MNELIKEMKERAESEEKFEQGGGCSELLYEAIEALEKLTAPQIPVFYVRTGDLNEVQPDIGMLGREAPKIELFPEGGEGMTALYRRPA